MDLSFQLYSARNFPLDQTLKTLSELGYTYVEGFGGVYSDLDGFKSLLDRNGLSMPTGHFGLDMLEQPQEAFKVIDTLGVKLVVCPWLAPDQRPDTAKGWETFARRLAEIGKPYADRGLTFGYHNHDFEFATTDGQVPMEVILEAAPELVCELDVAWVYRGGADAFAFMEKYGDRIAAIHVKDIASAGENLAEDGWADVGQGTLPWKDLLTTATTRTNARYFVAEHDNPSDATRFARRSIEAVNSFGV